MQMNTANTIEIYVQLLEEGTPTARPTQALDLGNGLYKVLPTPKYNPENEIWEFPPGSVVKCKRTEGVFRGMLLAIAP
jgi:hypothetical protein